VVVELMVMDTDKNEFIAIGDKTIVIANRLINWKMTHLFVDAFNTFSKTSNTPFKLIIIGDGPYFNKIAPFLDNEKIGHVNRFDDRDEMLAILKKSSLFVSMSLRDSGAASLLEAVSYGIPYLITDSGAHKLFLKNEVGYSFKLSNYHDDHIKIVDLLFNVLSDEAALDMEREKVFDLYNTHFSEGIKRQRLAKITSKF
jgi:glycosyltransferase involved in cell wall biosynthesis